MTEESLQNEVDRLISDPEIFKKRNEESSKEELKKIGVCCFSEDDDKLLMWSHYGDKHQGVCLTFDIEQDKDLFFNQPYCVEYLNFYPKINWIRDRNHSKTRRFSFGTKSMEWFYENEFRVIRNYTAPPYRCEVNFNKKSLIAIKFGYRSNTMDQMKIKNALDKVGGYEHVQFYMAKLIDFGFGIRYEKIF